MSAPLAILAALAASHATASAASWRQCTGDDAEKAVAGCNAVLRSGGQDDASRAAAFYDRGNAYRRQGRFDLAIADYDAALAVRSDYVEAFTNRGIAHYALRDYDRAIADYSQAIALRPDLAEPVNNRCLAYLKTYRYDLAQRDFDRTIRLNQNYGNALINRAFGPAQPAQ